MVTAQRLLRSGVVSRPRALYSRDVHLSWLEAGVANDDFLVHAPRPLIEASIEIAEQLAPRHGSCRSALEAP